MSTLARPLRRLAYAICFALCSVLLALGVILSMPFGLLAWMLVIPGMVFYFLAQALDEPTPGELKKTRTPEPRNRSPQGPRTPGRHRL